MPETWQFWTPFVKAFEDSEKLVDGQPKRVIEGVASTEDLDLQKEVVVQKGMDFSYFLANGFFNWDHGKKPEDILGMPEIAEIRTGGGEAVFYVKGFLFSDGYAPADKAWSLMKSMSPYGRQLGMSVEGSVVRRKGNHIVESVVRQVSLTHQPINQATWAQIAKSFTTSDAAPLLKEDLDSRITSILWGDTNMSCGHFDPKTLKFRSTRAAVEHLVKCLGYSAKSARAGLTLLRSAGIL